MKTKIIFLFSILTLVSSSVCSNENKQTNDSPLKNQALVLETIRLSAQGTQQSCMRFVQMNVFEFEECVSEKLKQKKLGPPERLGITYMGFVGALSAQRMGSQGSQMMAWKYAKASHKIQTQLKLDDQQLCALVPGDCVTRIARTEMMLKGPMPKPATDLEVADRHKH